MKRLLSFLLILALVLPAHAATDPPECGGRVAGPGGSTVTPAGCNPYQSFRSSDRSKHVMILRPSRWTAQSGTNLNAIRRASQAIIGLIADEMEQRGLEVHYYDSEFFESDADHKEMWTNAGSKYALCIVLFPQAVTGGGAGTIRYTCADSTNVQLVVVGGYDGNTLGWGANADTSARGFMDTRAGAVVARSDVNGAGCVTYDGVDTLWANFFSSGKRKFALDANITRVVRLLRPFTMTNVALVQNADSLNTLPTKNVGPNAYPDSVAAAGEELGPMWRVDYTNYSGQGNTAWLNTLADASHSASGGGLSPKSVYWFKGGDGTAVTRQYPHLLWALVCRFTTASAIPWAYDWDDVTDKFSDNLGQPPRWRASAADSSIAALREFGITPTTMVNPDHAAAYVRGTAETGTAITVTNCTTNGSTTLTTTGNFNTAGVGLGNVLSGSSLFIASGAYVTAIAANGLTLTMSAAATSSGSGTVTAQRIGATYESPWVGNPHTYLQGLTWVHHSHDSTYAHISSNLIGGFGGYSSGNGSNITQGATSIQKWGHRYASRWNPGANEAGFVGGTANFGLIQRLAYSDSVRGRVAPSATVPPYLAFPANEMLPVGWKNRPTTSNPLWTVNFSAGYECPIDSTFWAFDTMLVKGNGQRGGRLYLRTATDNPRGYASGVAGNPLGTTTQWDRDSVVAASPFLYPNERYTVPVNGRLVQAVGVNSFLQGASPRSQYLASGNYRTAFVLGLKNPVQRQEVANTGLGDTYSGDMNSVFAASGGGITGAKDFTGRMATRVVYQHPGQHGDTSAKSGDYHVDVFILSMATQMRMMDKIAGRRTQQCVPAWTVYGR